MILKKEILLTVLNREYPFNDLPDDYICPVCGAGKDEFLSILIDNLKDL